MILTFIEDLYFKQHMKLLIYLLLTVNRDISIMNFKVPYRGFSMENVF